MCPLNNYDSLRNSGGAPARRGPQSPYLSASSVPPQLGVADCLPLRAPHYFLLTHIYFTVDKEGITRDLG